jgi:hypothetical protein
MSLYTRFKAPDCQALRYAFIHMTMNLHIEMMYIYVNSIYTYIYIYFDNTRTMSLYTRFKALR